MTDPRLGRLVEHDPRSRSHQAPHTTEPHKRVIWRRYGMLKQDIGSCTGEAVVGALNTLPLHRKGQRTLRQADAIHVYSLATTLDPFPGSYPPDDTGSSGLAAAKAAQQLGLLTSYSHAFGVDHALDALQLVPVITGVNWYAGFDQPSPSGIVYATGRIRGGHEFEVVGYDPRTGLVTAVNSWGYGFGVNGRFRFTAETWDRLLREDGDVTVLHS